MARWLGIDHGTRRVGIAVGDTDTGIASPLEQLPTGMDALARRVCQLADAYEAAGAVVGWPVNADGSEGSQGRRARRFAAELAEATGMDVRLWDERLSSFEADDKLKGAHPKAEAAAARCSGGRGVLEGLSGPRRVRVGSSPGGGRLDRKMRLRSAGRLRWYLRRALPGQ